MALFDNKNALIRSSSLLDLNIFHICVAVFDYHVTVIFPFNVLCFVLEDDGQGGNFFTRCSDERKLPLAKDQVLFFTCGTKTKVDITPGITILAFHFNLSFFHGLDVFSDADIFEERHDPDCTARMSKLTSSEDNLQAACALQGEVMRFCVEHWPEKAWEMMPVIQKYEPIFHLVKEHGNATLTVADLAKQTGQRQDVFSRAFSRDLGKSPKEYLQEDLIRKISTRLLAPQSSVKETAAELAFSSEFYMSNFFKRRTGQSPREYQQKFRGKRVLAEIPGSGKKTFKSSG